MSAPFSNLAFSLYLNRKFVVCVVRKIISSSPIKSTGGWLVSLRQEGAAAFSGLNQNNNQSSEHCQPS
jgi:hypothetical protein